MQLTLPSQPCPRLMKNVFGASLCRVWSCPPFSSGRGHAIRPVRCAEGRLPVQRVLPRLCSCDSTFKLRVCLRSTVPDAFAGVQDALSKTKLKTLLQPSKYANDSHFCPVQEGKPAHRCALVSTSWSYTVSIFSWHARL